MIGVAMSACMVNFYPGRDVFYYLILLFCLIGFFATSVLVYFRGKRAIFIGKWLWRMFHFFVGFTGALTIAVRHKII